MILMVPISPEVPVSHKPKWWPSVLMVLTIQLAFVATYPTLQADNRYVESVQFVLEKNMVAESEVQEQANALLSKRPLLKISPSRADWDIERLIYGNFVHGTITHLALNTIGILAGFRICTSFIPFLCALSIFLLGGSFGLFASMFLTKQFSTYIPHVGASAGIFALMGTYYVYNFRYRTTYFFWFPSRKAGLTSLRTSWFFFVDVFLLELILSTAQFFPERLDSVDHIAHVVGFVSGLGLAFMLRSAQRWPGFLQTRAEFLYWRFFITPKTLGQQVKPEADRLELMYQAWIDLLQINRYNDQLKIRLCRTLSSHIKYFSADKIENAFRYFGPTFVRIHTHELGSVVSALFANHKKIPQRWLQRCPYDNLIQVAKVLSKDPHGKEYLLEFVNEYKKAQAHRPELSKKLTVLIDRLVEALPAHDNKQISK